MPEPTMPESTMPARRCFSNSTCDSVCVSWRAPASPSPLRRPTPFYGTRTLIGHPKEANCRLFLRILCCPMLQQGAGSFSHPGEHFVVLGQSLQNRPDGPDLLRPTIFRGIGEKLHLRVEAETIVLQKHLKPRTLKNGLRDPLHGLAESLDVLVPGVV